jgi:hypothetical protein
VRHALEAAAWDFAAAGQALGLKATTLEWTVKKWRWRRTA